MTYFCTAGDQQKWQLSQDANHCVYLDCYPFTPGTTIVATKRKDLMNIFQLPLEDFISLFLKAQAEAKRLCEKLLVQRCAMITEPKDGQAPQIKLIPLRGLDAEWKPIIGEDLEFHEEFPGYCTSRNGPRASEESLNSIQNQIRTKLQSQAKRFTFLGDSSDENLFAKLVRGEVQQWRVWEDDGHVAFLTPFPNTPGFTVLVPRKHLSSDIFSLEIEDYKKLLRACYEVNRLLQDSMKSETCCMIFEGYEIDYAHAKLIPVLRKTNKRKKSEATDFCSSYQGYVSSLDGPLAENEDLEKFYSILKI